MKISGFKKEQIITKKIDCYYENEWIETRWHTAYRMYFEQLPHEDYIKLKTEIIKILMTIKRMEKLRLRCRHLLQTQQKKLCLENKEPIRRLRIKSK